MKEIIKKTTIAAVICFGILLSAIAQDFYYSSDEAFIFLLERNGLRYYIFDETNSFDPVFFALKVKEYKKRPWYENEAVQKAIQESRDEGNEAEAGDEVRNIPQPIKDYGFTEEVFKQYYRKADKEYFIFYNWMTEDQNDLITFVIEGE